MESILTAYHDEYRRAFRESDSGRRFEDAFQVIVTDEGRREIDDAVRDIARNPYLDGEPSVLLNQVRSELKRIYEGIEDVRRQIRTSDEAVSRLVRQQTDTSYRTMLVKLNQLFAKTSAEAKANPNDPSRPYHTGAGAGAVPSIAVTAGQVNGASHIVQSERRSNGDRRSARPQEHGRNMRAASDTHDQAYSPQSGDDIGRHVRGSCGKLQPGCRKTNGGKANWSASSAPCARRTTRHT